MCEVNKKWKIWSNRIQMAAIVKVVEFGNSKNIPSQWKLNKRIRQILNATIKANLIIIVWRMNVPTQKYQTGPEWVGRKPPFRSLILSFSSNPIYTNQVFFKYFFSALSHLILVGYFVRSLWWYNLSGLLQICIDSFKS